MRLLSKVLAAVGVVVALALCGFVSPTSIGPSDVPAPNPPVVSIPDTVFVAEGREFNLWYSELTASIPGAPYFSAVAECDSGLSKKRSFRWTPVESFGPDAVDLGVDIMDPSGVVRRSVSTVLQSVENDDGAGAENFEVLFVGDSLIASSTMITEVYDLSLADGGGTFDLIGTLGSGTDLHEAVSGRGIRYFTGSSSPFWDTDALNLQSYISDNSFPDLDIVVIQLGTNDISWIIDYVPMTTAQLDSCVIYTKQLIDAIQDETTGYPDCKVIVGLTGFYAMDPWSAGTDAGSSNRWPIIRENARKYRNRMIAEFDGGAYGTGVDVCDGGIWLDRELGYDYSSVASSNRISTTEPTYSNFFHPSTAGYKQVADAYYSHIRHVMSEAPACVNLLVNSDNWAASNGTSDPVTGGWTISTTFDNYYTMTTGQDDPWGGTDATLFTRTADATANIFTAATSVTATDTMALAYAIIKKTETTDADDRTEIRIVDGSDVGSAFVVWSATPAYFTTGALDTAGGLDDLEDGWYRLWIYCDLDAARVGHALSVRFGPVSLNHNENDAVLCAGIQLEFGNSTPCGSYIQTP